MQSHFRRQFPNPNKKRKQKESPIDKAVTTAYMGTIGWSAGNAPRRSTGKTHKPETTTDSLIEPDPRKHLNTTQNSFAKFVARWDTQPETVIREYDHISKPKRLVS